MKNTVALTVGGNIFLSQHIGDLETVPAHTAFERVIADLGQLYAVSPAVIACDAHPDYRSTQYAEASGLPVVRVQHHLAHVLACMAENELTGPVLGVAWDGTGFGPDGMIWGGEFFYVTDEHTERVAHLRPFPLPGGDQAIKEPRRTALGLLYALHGEALFDRGNLAPLRAFSVPERAVLRSVLARTGLSPLTTSVGRLFDAVAALCDLSQRLRFEGQAAMALEFALAPGCTEAYPMTLTGDTLDWATLVEAVCADLARDIPVGVISARFHNGLVEGILAVARWSGIERVALSGGCFQNLYLIERAVTRLREAGFRPYWHQRVPPNDGGIALGQVVAALRAKE